MLYCGRPKVEGRWDDGAESKTGRKKSQDAYYTSSSHHVEYVVILMYELVCSIVYHSVYIRSTKVLYILYSSLVERILCIIIYSIVVHSILYLY